MLCIVSNGLAWWIGLVVSDGWWRVQVVIMIEVVFGGGFRLFW